MIVDEAHSSQTGTSALKLKAALADTEQALREYAEIEVEAEGEVEDWRMSSLRALSVHGRHENLTFCAFTATPKEQTLEIFGVEHPDDLIARSTSTRCARRLRRLYHGSSRPLRLLQ